MFGIVIAASHESNGTDSSHTLLDKVINTVFQIVLPTEWANESF